MFFYSADKNDFAHQYSFLSNSSVGLFCKGLSGRRCRMMVRSMSVGMEICMSDNILMKLLKIMVFSILAALKTYFLALS